MTEILAMWWANVSVWLPWVGLLILFNVLIGTVRALAEKKFDWQIFPKYILSDVLPAVVWLGVALLALAPQLPDVGGGGTLVDMFGYGADLVLFGVIAKEVASIAANLQALNAIPDIIKRGIKKLGVDHTVTD